MGILQATSTQTDYVASFYFAAFVLFGLRTIRSRSFAFLEVIFATISLGIGLLSKLTVAIFAIPFAVWFMGELIAKRKYIELLKIGPSGI
jgi:uncharacterized protein YqgC (DUF456 family)